MDASICVTKDLVVRDNCFSSLFRHSVGIGEWIFLVCVKMGRFFFYVSVGVFSVGVF